MPRDVIGLTGIGVPINVDSIGTGSSSSIGLIVRVPTFKSGVPFLTAHLTYRLCIRLADAVLVASTATSSRSSATFVDVDAALLAPATALGAATRNSAPAAICDVHRRTNALLKIQPVLKVQELGK